MNLKQNYMNRLLLSAAILTIGLFLCWLLAKPPYYPISEFLLCLLSTLITLWLLLPKVSHRSAYMISALLLGALLVYHFSNLIPLLVSVTITNLAGVISVAALILLLIITAKLNIRNTLFASIVIVFVLCWSIYVGRLSWWRHWISEEPKSDTYITLQLIAMASMDYQLRYGKLPKTVDDVADNGVIFKERIKELRQKVKIVFVSFCDYRRREEPILIAVDKADNTKIYLLINNAQIEEYSRTRPVYRRTF